MGSSTGLRRGCGGTTHYSPKIVPQYVLDPVTGVELRKMMPVVDIMKSFTTPVHSSQTTLHDCR